MTDTTPTYGLPFYEDNDAPNLPDATQTLALAVEDELERIDASVATLNGLQTVIGNNPNVEGPYSGTTLVPGTQVCGVAFTAPASGSVMVFWKADFQAAINDKMSFVSVEIRSGASIGGGSVVVSANSDDAIAIGGTVTSGVPVRLKGGTFRLITGLTPGNSYHARNMHQTESGGSITINDRQIMVQPQL